MTINGKKRFVTQADVAREAQVSRALVSLVMQGSPKVSAERRDRVLEAAERLGYIGSNIASNLAGNSSHYLIGFLAQSLRNQIFIDVYEGLLSALSSSGHRVVVMQGSIDPEEEDKTLRNLISLRPDGIVLGGYAGSKSALKAAARTLPVVSVTRHIDELGIDSVLGNDFNGAYSATEELINLGHSHIGHIQLPSNLPYEERARGYLAAMNDHGLANMLITTDLSQEGAFTAVSRMIEHKQLPTGLFCANDVLALGALEALESAGLNVPHDVSVIGYDNTDLGRKIGLCSVDQHGREMGHIAGETVVSRLAEERTKTEVIVKEPQFIRRSSIGPSPEK